MAFFKEKRTQGSSLASQTVVDWGKTIMQGMNSEVLTKHYQRKFDQKIKDLEATPQVFDTTLSFFEPKILERVTTLQEEYKKNASIAYNRPDFSNAAVEARQRNAEIIKEISRMQGSIQSLQEDENAFAEDPGNFYPDVINENLSSDEFLVREAYTELINGDYKNNNAEVVKDVYFTDGGKVMVDIEGLGPVDLKDLRSFDQPTEGLKTGYIEKLANIATTSVEDSAEAGALQTELLGDVLNNLNYYEKLELLNARVTISPEFSGGNIKDTLTPKEDTRYEELFRTLVKDADKHIKNGNWHAFFNPKVRKEKGMVLNDGVEQPDVIQGVEDFVRDFTLDISNQFIKAGKDIQKQRLIDEQERLKKESEIRYGGSVTARKEKALKGFYTAVTNEVLSTYGQDSTIFNQETGEIVDMNKYKKIWMQSLVNDVGNSSIAFVGTYDDAMSYFLADDAIGEALETKLQTNYNMIEGKHGENTRNVFERLLVNAYNKTTMDNNTINDLKLRGLLEEKTEKVDRGTLTYYTLTNKMLQVLEDADLMKFPQIQEQYERLINTKFYKRALYQDKKLVAKAKDFSQLYDVLNDILFNRYTQGTDFEDKANLFTIGKSGAIHGHGGDPTTETGKVLLGNSLLSEGLVDATKLAISGAADLNPTGQ